MRVRLYDNGAMLAASGDATHGALAEFDGEHGYHTIKVDGASWEETTVTVTKPRMGPEPGEAIVRHERTTGTVGGGTSSVWETTFPDGATEKGSKSVDRDQNTSETVVRTDAAGGQTITTTTRDRAGNFHSVEKASDGTETVEDVHRQGSTLVTETVTKDASGQVLKEERSSSASGGGAARSLTTSNTEGGLTTLRTETADGLQSTVQITWVDSSGAEIGSSRQTSTWDAGSQTFTVDGRTFDGQGNVTSETRGFAAGNSSSTRTEYSDGRTALTTRTKEGDVTTSETTVVDAHGHTLSESRAAEAGDARTGPWSRSESTTDDRGNVTITTTTGDKDGNSTTHTTTTDSEGNVTSDTTEEHHAGDDEHHSNGDGQGSGNQAAARYPSDDDGVGDDTGQRGPHLSRSMLRGLEGTDDENEGDPNAQVRSALGGLVGRHVDRPSGSGDDRGEDALGRPQIDVQLPDTLGDLDVWDDPNDPRAYLHLTDTLRAGALTASQVQVAAELAFGG